MQRIVPLSSWRLSGGIAGRRNAMQDVVFWRRQAALFRDEAETRTDASQSRELRELAEICEQVAAEIEDRVPAG
jgi:hypothetical protein